MRLSEKSGWRSVPTGLDFGTITILINHRPFEVTTLRTDLASDGRHALVAFGKDWQQDAKRRDFTINALYCDGDGVIHDYVGGLDDIEHRHIRFIGDSHARIREDYLRILRFFRFFAYYGDGRPDKAALTAIVSEREGLLKLSAERIWSELKKMLLAPNPHRAVLWMRQSGVLSLIVPESEKWGIDLFPGLIEAEKICGFPADPLLRLMSMIPPDRARVSELAHRLKLSGTEKNRLIAWSETASLIPNILAPDISARDLKKILYRQKKSALQDCIKLALAADIDAYGEIFLKIEQWQRPHFPLNGHDLMEHGVTSGPELGRILTQLEEIWIDSDFSLTKAQLLAALEQNAIR